MLDITGLNGEHPNVMDYLEHGKKADEGLHAPECMILKERSVKKTKRGIALHGSREQVE